MSLQSMDWYQYEVGWLTVVGSREGGGGGQHPSRVSEDRCHYSQYVHGMIDSGGLTGGEGGNIHCEGIRVDVNGFLPALGYHGDMGRSTVKVRGRGTRKAYGSMSQLFVATAGESE